MLRCCWIATLAACGFASPPASPADPDGGPGSDAPPDGSGLCFGTFVEVCLAAPPGAPLTVNSGQTRTIDTGEASPDCVQTTNDPGACVVAATSIAVSGLLRGTGARPLILLAIGAIQVNVNGAIDVSSKRGMPPGSGANPAGCVPGTNPTVRTGGWGGTNATRGGNGDQAGPGSTGGVASAPLATPTRLLGGCPGGNGAGGGDSGDGGAGGGAVDLIAPAINIDGRINASGAGAGGASGGAAGGGGGGAGGLIVLDSPDVTFNGTGILIAQGGGGGEGGTSVGGSGGNGDDPVMPGQPAQGGDGSSTGGDGGDGATDGDGGDGGADSGGGGGGGGGGGAGFIRTTDPSPPPAADRICPPIG